MNFNTNGHLDHNIALVRVKKDFVFNHAVNRVDLMTSAELPTHMSYVVLGEHNNKLIHPVSNTLHLTATKWKLNDRRTCNKAHILTGGINAGEVCASYLKHENHFAKCYATPGSLLMVDGYLAGLATNINRKCNLATYKPAVFTKIGDYKKWLSDNIQFTFSHQYNQN